MQNKAIILIFVFATLLFSCQQNKQFSSYTSISNGWNIKQSVAYKFVAPDTINPYNLYINLRTTNDYSFNNLFLVVELNHPYGKVTKDTLEYKMANLSGELLGSGFSSVKEHKLWFKGFDKSFVFSESGPYKVQIQHAMRLRGETKGITLLKGIIDVGFSIESLEKQ
ncbi:MAG: gliding motility lipoprotein GldH [Algibacter sp.]|uniref:gliding motility lipoprotein GldH n=1 Tax=Algibacter sp. TaxID=1872428 RepID=UPI00261978D5|nr:gliding motility lipoprotein GldH [Algibacter sp.]MDG1315329.1 gliding motility lipoprotein GldH [Flavobacteriaceae bacterium]MDG1728903.1 gliding motility lipoprotein GldH [Algibacter sp.]|tara:strand:+ start:404 stop:904 length:501 start_codon:yes stop_codon:yes gene_type:complete